MQPKFCIDIFGRCPRKFRNRRYEHSLVTPIDEANKQSRQILQSHGLPTHFLKYPPYKRHHQYGARINQSFKQKK